MNMEDLEDLQVFKIMKASLPEIAHTKYLRGIWRSSLPSFAEVDQSFEEWKKAYENRMKVLEAIRYEKHPVEYKFKFQLTPHKNVRIFKRKGEKLCCSYFDMTPGDEDSKQISLEEALQKIQDG